LLMFHRTRLHKHGEKRRDKFGEKRQSGRIILPKAARRSGRNAVGRIIGMISSRYLRRRGIRQISGRTSISCEPIDYGAAVGNVGRRTQRGFHSSMAAGPSELKIKNAERLLSRPGVFNWLIKLRPRPALIPCGREKAKTKEGKARKAALSDDECCACWPWQANASRSI